jgi:hypothetical protein
MICSCCTIDKDIREFPKRNNKPRNPCRLCANEKSKLAKRKRRSDFKEEENLKRKIYISNNQVKIKNTKNIYRKTRYKEDIEYNIEHRFRSRLNKLTRNLNSKQEKSITYLGCTKLEFKIYIENQFSQGMSWENRNEWHLDHIIPCSKFNLSKEEDLKKCFHYSNLQPLWAKDNLIKRDK